MSQIKILHIIHSLATGGLENGLVNLINKMDRNKFSHSICCITHSSKYAENLRRQDVEIFEMEKKDGIDIHIYKRLARLIRLKQVDIVHTRNWAAIDGIIGARIAGISKIIHGEHGRGIADPEGSNKKRNIIRKGLSHFVNSYIAVSQDLSNWLIKQVGVDQKKVHTIHNGVDTTKYNADDKVSIRAVYGYSDSEVIIGVVGRLDPIKDQQLLINAFAQLTRSYKNITLLMIGDGPCRKNLEKMVCDDSWLSKKVHFLGMRTDIPELLKLLNIFVLPSINEGISNTILEAMATGLPIVATSVGGNSELVLHGKNGYLFPKQNNVALVNVLERYIRDQTLRINHGMASRDRAVSEFNLDKMVSEYEAVYSQIVEKGR